MNTMEAKVRFVEYSEKDFKGYTLIEGFPGMGLVGTIAAKYLVERLKFKDYGHIESNIFVPIIRIHKGVPVFPSRIYVNDELKLIVLISEQIIPKQFTHKIADSIVEWIEKKKINRVVSLSGIHTEDSEEIKDTVYGIAANEKSKKLLENHEIATIEDGITTGITALMLLALREKPIEGISILGNVSIAADYKAASELIKKLSEILNFEIDVKPLIKEARATEEELLKHFDNIKKHEAAEKTSRAVPYYT